MKKFTWQQIFRLKIQTLERRIPAYYNQHGDAVYVIKVVCALLFRNYISETVTVSCPCKELVREIYLTLPVSDELAVHIGEFREYFSKAEWQLLWETYFWSSIFPWIPKIIGVVRQLFGKKFF